MSFRAILGGFTAVVTLTSLAACDQSRDLARGNPPGTTMQRSAEYATGSSTSGGLATESGGGPRSRSGIAVQRVMHFEPPYTPADFPSNRAGSD